VISSVFVFGTDLLHEGFDSVLDNLQHRAGVDAVSLSATYHHARDVFTHNPRHKIYRHQGDIAWFKPEVRSYYSGLVPRLAADAGDEDVLARLCDCAGARGLDVQAWTIFTHNSWLATNNPDCATRNVYGDAYWTDLCPANPRVRDYACELAKDLARYPIRRLLAESLHYRPFEHGDHHERYLIRIPPAERRLLSLCFCAHCRAAGTSAGLDMKFLAREVVAALGPVWTGKPLSDTKPALLLDHNTQSMLEAYAEVRTDIVAGLVAQVQATLAPNGIELSFIDHGGAMAHVMLGVSADQPVTESSRKLGVDVAKVVAAGDEITALGYVDTPERLRALLGRYREILGEAKLAVALRPLLPDCEDPLVLAAKAESSARAGAGRIDFYHYAMMPLDRLDWIAAALAAARAAIPEARVGTTRP
jgi:hypothetical protein